MIAEKYIDPALLATFSGMIEQPPAMPAVPRPLPLIAAATDAEPWPCAPFQAACALLSKPGVPTGLPPGCPPQPQQ